MDNITRQRLAAGIDGLIDDITSKKLDRFAPIAQEHSLATTLQDAWELRVQRAAAGLRHLGGGIFGSLPSADEVMRVLTSQLSGDAIHGMISPVVRSPIQETFDMALASVDAMFKKQTGKEIAKKDFVGPGFGLIFGLTEQHALEALTNQLIVSAGGFFDQQLSDSIKKQIEDILATSTSRDRAIKAIENLVNDKLSINGINALPTSYFDNLATHQIVRSRNIGSIYQASSVGSKSYTLINPRDTRTSPVCLAVTNGQVFHMADALSVAEGLIGARTMQDLRSVQPFARQGSDIGKGPVPPLHWPKCRTWMNWIFAGLG